MEQYMIWFWLGIFILAIIIEAATQDLISIWFGLGAVVALIFSAINGIPWYVELIIFSVVSLLLLFFTRSLAKKLLFNSVRYTNVDDLVGKKVKVISKITKFDKGEVRINDIIYTAILCEDCDEVINEGEVVEIVTFKGNKVIVKKVK